MYTSSNSGSNWSQWYSNASGTIDIGGSGNTVTALNTDGKVYLKTNTSGWVYKATFAG